MTVDQPKIFFSYAREDAVFALKLANDLRSAGISLWIDQLDIPPGEQWDIAVENALKVSPCLLIVLSPASVVSQNVMDEVAFARENNKKIVPVLHTRCSIPFRIQRLQYIDFTVAYNNGLTQLISALNVLQPSQMTPSSALTADPYEGASRGKRNKSWLLSKLLITVVTVAFIGTVVYWFARPSLAPPPKDQNGIHEAVSLDIHEAAYILIKGATEKASIICRDIKMLKAKQQHLQIGINFLGDTTDLDSLKKQIRDYEKNIDDDLDVYSDFIAKLSGVESAIVDKEMNKYNDSLTQKSLFPRIKITQIVFHDYQESLKGKLNVNIDVMEGLCP